MTRRIVLAIALLMALAWSVAGAGAAAASSPTPPALAVTGACLIDADTGQQLFAQNGDAELPIASTTKLMTALVVLQHFHGTGLGAELTQNDYYPAAADSQIGLVPGERMSVHDLLLALLLPSADDAAEDLAYNVGGGSIPRFVGMMNAAARALHLTHTRYTTPSGLDTPGNHSSPCDLDRLADYDLHYSAFFRRAVDLPSATLYSGRRIRHVTNTDDLVGSVPWIDGIKTGHTADAGYVLVSQGVRDGMTLIGSVLGTSSEAARDANALALLNYGFAGFHVVAPVRAGQVLARPSIRYLSTRAVVVAAGGFSRMLPRTDAVRVVVRVPRQLTGPLPRGRVVGMATIEVAGRPAAEVPLRLAASVPAVSAFTRAARFLVRPTTLILIVLALGAGSAAVVARRRRPRAIAAGRLEER